MTDSNRPLWRQPHTGLQAKVQGQGGEDPVRLLVLQVHHRGEVYKDTVREARTTRQAAEAERRARQAKYDGVYGPKGKRQLLSAFVREVYLLHVEQHNRDFYHYQVHAGILCEYFRGRTLGQISPLAVESFKRDRLKTPVKGDRPRKPRAVNAELTTLSAVCSRAVRLGLLRENPCRRVEWFKAEDGPSVRLPAEDEGALLESAESEPPFLAPMIRLALWTSFRQGELIALAKPAVTSGATASSWSTPSGGRTGERPRATR